MSCLDFLREAVIVDFVDVIMHAHYGDATAAPGASRTRVRPSQRRATGRCKSRGGAKSRSRENASQRSLRISHV